MVTPKARPGVRRHHLGRAPTLSDRLDGLLASWQAVKPHINRTLLQDIPRRKK